VRRQCWERDPGKVFEWVALARSAILDRIEDGHTKSLNGERHDLRDALTTLDGLRRIAERQIAMSQTLVDSCRDGKVPTRSSWQESYQAALLETDWTKMQERVQTAESEIHQRRLVLSQDHAGTDEERAALVNAMSGLRVLRMNVASCLERQNLRKPVQNERRFPTAFGSSPDKAVRAKPLT